MCLVKYFEEFYNKKSVLVTGGAGFIGSHLVEALVEYGASVTVLDNLSNGQLGHLSGVLDKITFIKGTIEDKKICENASKNCSIVFHMAAIVPEGKHSNHSPQKCHDVNSKGTHIVLEAARKNNASHFIFASSSSVYGAHEGLCHEELNCKPTSIYGYSKLHGELFCREYAHLFGMNVVCLRFFNVFGLRQQPLSKYTISRQALIEKKSKTSKTPLHEQIISVEDAVTSTLHSCMIPERGSHGHLYNIANHTEQLITKPNKASNLTKQPKTLADCSRYQKALQELQP